MWKRILIFSMLFCILSVPVLAQAGNTFDPFSGIAIDNQGVNVGQVKTDALDYEKVFIKYKNLLIFIVGMITITAFGVMIYRFFRLAAAGSNEQERRKAISGIMVSGTALALMGAASIIIGIAYHALQ